MRRALTIYRAAFRSSIKSMLAYPQDLLFELLSLPINAFSSFLTIFVIASNTLLEGWDFAALLALGGVHMLIGGLVNALIEPNLRYFSNRVLDGKLDDTLMMPMRPLFTATLLRQSPAQLLPALAGFAAAVWGGVMAGADPLRWLLFLAALPVSFVLAWALRTILATVCFFFRGTDLTVVYSALWQFQRYPAGIYPFFLRAAMYAIPFALIAAPPAVCLAAGRYSPLLIEAGAACLLALIARGMWREGIKRYASATS